MYRVGRLAMVCVLLATLLLTGPAGVAQAGQAPQAGAVRLRIGVTVDGIVRLTPSDLATAGVDPASVDPRTFAMSSMGQPVAIKITGEADGRFDGADVITFFGQKFRGTQFQEKYTDERVYWLEAGGTAGPRIASIDATPQGDLTPPQDVAATVRARVPLTYWNLNTLAWVNITQETWFWARLQPTAAAPATAALSYEVPDPAPGPQRHFACRRCPGMRAAPAPSRRIALPWPLTACRCWIKHGRAPR